MRQENYKKKSLAIRLSARRFFNHALLALLGSFQHSLARDIKAELPGAHRIPSSAPASGPPPCAR